MDGTVDSHGVHENLPGRPVLKKGQSERYRMSSSVRRVSLISAMFEDAPIFPLFE